LQQYDAYFRYLKTRSRLALMYRRAWLYPRLSAQVRGRVLDVGCGIGDMLKARRGTVGVDINPHLVEYCRNQGLDAHLMEPNQLPFESGSFDGAILDNVLEHIADPGPLLAEIHRVLRAEARFIVGVPGAFAYTLDPDHKHFYSESQLHARMNSAGFALIRTLYSPFRSSSLDSSLRWYAIYGVYEKRFAGE